MSNGETQALRLAAPYGVFDVGTNNGFAAVGVSHNGATFGATAPPQSLPGTDPRNNPPWQCPNGRGLFVVPPEGRGKGPRPGHVKPFGEPSHAEVSVHPPPLHRPRIPAVPRGDASPGGPVVRLDAEVQRVDPARRRRPE